MSASEAARGPTSTGASVSALPGPGGPDLPLPRVHRGKVRELYDAGDGFLLMVASDRVSAFDVVLPQPIPRKGEVLTLLTAWWMKKLGGVVPHHLVSARPEEILERLPQLADVPRADWARRSLLVRRTRPLPIECVVRGYLAGSAWAEYRKSGTLAGETLPAGLTQSQKLPVPIFSPATKATEGHDENITFQEVCRRVGTARAERLRKLSHQIYAFGRDTASARGILLADTKFEFGELEGGELLLIDEVLTPDSSRYWPKEGWRPGGTPPSLDKQPIRDWLDALPDWDRSPPPPDLTPGVVDATTKRYREVFMRLTGVELSKYEPPSFDSPSRSPSGSRA
ncbi:MAG: phosphoribosylaminoimidazolesuccinocarboxamide synthase [Gemmatimonadetes bacterium]|nr:phosphoribosylaminoimidazolesuccinocarboxamide synthase [Gemmatimonadota bacterium]